MADRLALPLRYRDQLESLLREHVPGIEVWAYGSRVNGESHDGSDLDLVLRGPALEPLDGGFFDLLEAIEKSNVPILVQAHDWATLPESFHREIERDYVVVQEGAKQTTAGEWQTCTLGELTDNFDAIRIPVKETDRGVGPYPYYGASGVVDHVDGFLFDGEYLLIAEDGENLRTRTTPIAFLANGKFWVNNHAHIVQGNSNADTRFLKYALSVLDISGYLTGSTMPKLTQGNMNRIPLLTPPLPKQRTIAYVLGTLDDKIELNRRMNETLEAMARALFKSWFVDFEPVRAKMEGRWRPGESLPGLPAEHYDLFPDRLADSELGEIPEGWEAKTLGSFGEIVTGKTPSTKEPAYFGDDVPFLRIPDMHRNMYVLQTDMMLSTLGADSQPGKTLSSGSVSVSCIATPGLVVLNHRHTQTNQQINTIVPRDQPISRYLYWVCRHLSKDIETGGLGGSVLGNMNKSSFSALLVLNPEAAVLRAFDELASPLHTMILATEEQSQTLTQERDTLLPRLVSGEVRVGTE